MASQGGSGDKVDPRSDYYQSWDAKAKALAAEVDAEEEQAPKNEAEGPTIAKAKAERADLDAQSSERSKLIAELEGRVVQVATPDECAAVSGKAVRVVATGGRFVLPDRVTKVFVEKSSDVVVVCGDVITKSCEMYSCKGVRIEFASLGTIQVDDCEECELHCSSAAGLGDVYFAHSKGLKVVADGREVGVLEATQQHYASLSPDGTLATQLVGRLENEFPSTLHCAKGTAEQHAAAAPSEKDEAAKFRLQGNESFRANDFMQATALYSRACDCDPEETTALLNRAQCWLKLGQPDKALDDAERCLAVDSSLVKAHFRKGISLHALKRYGEAVVALVQAEKLDPKNTQVQDSIKMAQMMARKQ